MLKTLDDFKKATAGILESAKNKLTKDSSNEEIQAVSSLEEQLNGINKDYEDALGELSGTKDLLIKSMKNEGSKEAPKDEADSQKEKSLEDIARELLAKEKGGQ